VRYLATFASGEIALDFFLDFAKLFSSVALTNPEKAKKNDEMYDFATNLLDDIIHVILRLINTES
jgi:hypothetical protein